MNYLYDYINNGYNINTIYILSISAIISGVLVITSKNPIVSVLFLIVLFFNVACFLIIIGLNFIGLSYLLIYVGAISILFLFILMLINIRVSELISETKNSIPLIIITFLLFNFIMNNILLNNNEDILMNINNNNYNIIYSIIYTVFFYNIYNNITSENISNISYFSWDGNLIDLNSMVIIGNVMYTIFPIWLIITSLILLLAMIGAIAITINYKK